MRDAPSVSEVQNIPQGAVVFPLLSVDLQRKHASVIGSAFRLGDPPICVTASHVLRAAEQLVVAQVVVRGREHRAITIDNVEHHPSVDVAVFALDADDLWPSPLRLSARKVVGGTSYVQWGYPTDASHREPATVTQPSVITPEPVFVRGYVRRRYDRALPIPRVAGTRFLELSELAGRGASGSPVLDEQAIRGGSWISLGVYVGENLTPDLDRPAVSYALSCADFADWTPTQCPGPLVIDVETG